MPITCIVESESEYKLEIYGILMKMPNNCVLRADGDTEFRTYELTNGVKIKFLEYSYYNDNKPSCQFSYENIVFKKIEKEDFNLQTVAGYMNKFKNLSEIELTEIISQVNQKIKPQLQLEIEELIAEKKALEIKIKKYKEIFGKLDQIKSDLSKIENDFKNN